MGCPYEEEIFPVSTERSASKSFFGKNGQISSVFHVDFIYWIENLFVS